MLSVAIIGAGPFGLSLAAHLKAENVSFRIFGKSMQAWKEGMPAGMLLKSYVDSSNLSDPAGRFTLKRYSDESKLYYPDSQTAISLQKFIDYGEAFQKQCVPDLVEKNLVHLSPIERGGFRAVFEDGEVVEAKRVVLAIGVHPFKYVPPALTHLPDTVVSHSGEFHFPEKFDGKRVVVVGGGASAIDIAVLLHERGVPVSLVARAPNLRFGETPGGKRDWLHEIARPNSGLGVGWPLWFLANAPALFHALPTFLRRRIVQRTLGPLGGYTMRLRSEGQLPIHLGCTVEQARQLDNRVELRLRRRDGRPAVIQADRVIAATGYRTDFRRLGFLAPELLQRLRLDRGGEPMLSRSYETSAPGLFVIGPASALSFGPVARFIYGAGYPARHLAKRFATGSAQVSVAPKTDRLPVAAPTS